MSVNKKRQIASVGILDLKMLIYEPTYQAVGAVPSLSEQDVVQLLRN